MAKIGSVSVPGVAARPRGRNGRADVIEPRLRWRDLAQARSKPLLFWGIVTLITFALNFVLPSTVSLLPAYRFATMINGALYTIMAMMVLRMRLIVVLPVLAFLAMQVWATVSYAYGFTVTARPDQWGKQLFFAYEIVMPYFATYTLCQLNPHWRQGTLNLILWLLTLSAFVGILQFISFPGFGEVYKYYSWSTVYDISGEKYKGVRAVGLTSHPLILGVQAVTALSIIGSRFLTRGMRWHEYFQAATLCLALVMSQGRTMYVAGAFVVILVIITLARRRPDQAFVTLASISAIFLVAAAVFPDKFQYAFSSIGVTGRDTFAVRREIWQQYGDIFNQFSLTGIGTDGGVFGATYSLPGRWSLRLMENAYLAFYAMLGAPGLILFVGGIVGSFFGCVRILRSRDSSDEWKRAAFVGLSFTMLIAIYCTTSNTFDSNMVGHLGFIIAGVVAAYIPHAMPAKAARPVNGQVMATSAPTD
jgi:hypothetical protein